MLSPQDRGNWASKAPLALLPLLAVFVSPKMSNIIGVYLELAMFFFVAKPF
jgi:hypothetical protein